MKPLSFIIITYDRPEDMLALAVNISKLDRASELLEEVIVINNASKADYGDVESFMASQKEIPFVYVHSAQNLGVSRGRNFAIRQGRAPILIMLDDDAELQGRDALVRLMEAFDLPNTKDPKAIVSFRVLYYNTLKMQVNAFPHKRFSEYEKEHFLETHYYAGGAHAITRESIEKAGLYPEDFFYGMEEYDLSYRLIEAGYSITYSDSITMLHKESPLGRQPNRDKMRMMWVNKTKVAWRYLPVIFFISTAVMWSLEYLRKTGFDWGGWRMGWKDVASIPGNEKRKPVGNSAMDYLRKTKARLWY